MPILKLLESHNGLSNFALVPKGTTGLVEEYIVSTDLWFIHCDRDFIVVCNPCRPLTLCWILRCYEGKDEEGFHPHSPPTAQGLFSLFVCLCRFNPNHNPPKWRQALIPNGIYFTLAESPETFRGWRGHPLEFLLPTSVLLNLSMWSESHFQPIHVMPSSSPWARLLCHRFHRIFSN